MQFIADGPDIPDALLQAHEEGRVVFFCGAGISYPAGLPNFQGLVDKVYQYLGATLNEIEREAYDRHQFDATLDLLERRIPGKRIAVRTALIESLQPDLHRQGATDTHAALLKLARDRQGALRLLTTNFDRIFEHVAEQSEQSWNPYSAPMLPVPKTARWNGLVYLHGVLPDKVEESDLNRLVVTSGDFGLAYLTERWAARFVTELFRNYLVCFVGYSIDDPVLRYMMDALAADRMLGEATPQAYAFGNTEPDLRQRNSIKWEAKNVTPILYEVPQGSKNHSALHRTLQAWAETYQDGTLGKERIVVEYALARPSASTRQDDFVGRMLWALSDESGLPAKRFADYDPTPPLEWLTEFADIRYQHNDLSRFGISPRSASDQNIRFSLIHRPAPYNRAPWMTLVGSRRGSACDDVMLHIARWLTRHLNDPKLIRWLSERRGQLHDHWSTLIKTSLDHIADLEREAKTSELDRIREKSPNAIPGPLMRTLWRLLLTGRVKSSVRDLDLLHWQQRWRRDGLTASLRMEFRHLFAPKIRLSKPFEWGEQTQEPGSPKRLEQIVRWELVLATDHVSATISNPSWSGARWKDSLPALFDDLQLLLHDALGLLRELDRADDRQDGSFWILPSITPHWQNKGLRDWVVLIELLRESWLAVRRVDDLRATRLAREWFNFPYPTFKRLAFFAASQDGCLPSKQWVDWLSSGRSWWLWSLETQREVLRLFALQGHHLAESQSQLETAILAGPPREMYKDDLEPERWQDLVDRAVWLRLAKLDASTLTLGNAARHRLDALSEANPNWRLLSHEREEFSRWMSGTGSPDYEERRVIDTAPRNRHELVEWLQKPPPGRRLDHEDTWQETCRDRFFHSFFALCDLAQENIWPKNRWREALQVWSQQDRIQRSWHYAAPLVQTMPDSVLQEVDRGVAWWLEAASKSSEQHEDILMLLCQRVLKLASATDSAATQDTGPMSEPVTDAINHPVGLVTQALINLWFKRQPNDDDRLPAEIETIFTPLCDVRIGVFLHARVVLASRLIALFRIDQTWTERRLLPLFRWDDNSDEAEALWEGFLWSPRIYPPFLLSFKRRLLETSSYYDRLGQHKRQFAAFLTFAALERPDGYTSMDFQSAFDRLPHEGLQDAAKTLAQSLDGAAKQREDYWKNRIRPFWQEIWPKSIELASSTIAESLALMSIAAGKQFPSALDDIHGWLQPVEHPDYVVHTLCESDHCRDFPDQALRLLGAILHDQQWAPRDLGQCLEAIAHAAPKLRQDHSYQRLLEFGRHRGVIA